MSCYVSSNNNRFYVGSETAYGIVPAIAPQNRIAGIKLLTRQVAEQIQRRDKTGSRTFPGLPNSIRKNTTYQFTTLLTEWSNQTTAPAVGTLFQAGMGGSPVFFNGGTVASTSGTTGITFVAAHQLVVGQALTHAGEIRFVASIVNGMSIFVNAPFTNLGAGAIVGTAVTYRLATDIGSVSLFDYWDPSGAVNRIVDGAIIDRIRIQVNSDFHQFAFSGPSKDLLDNVSFQSGEGGLTLFPNEPSTAAFDYNVVPGHLGQIWMGAGPTQFSSLTSAELLLRNDVAVRVREFGSDSIHCVSPGRRTVQLNFSIFEDLGGDAAVLYQAARQHSPMGVMLQLGQQNGQLFGAYMPAMIPEVPEFDDGESRLEWHFQNNRAQGSVNDELYVAFG